MERCLWMCTAKTIISFWTLPSPRGYSGAISACSLGSQWHLAVHLLMEMSSARIQQDRLAMFQVYYVHLRSTFFQLSRISHIACKV